MAHAIDEDDFYARKRQRDFRSAAGYVARELGLLPCVVRVQLFGSVSRPLERERARRGRGRRAGLHVLHECKDIDLAVFVTDTLALRSLQRARVTGLRKVLEHENTGVAHHQVDVFIFDVSTGHHVGRLRSYRECPVEKPECRVPGCGDTHLLRQHQDFLLDPGALDGAEQLYPDRGPLR